MVECPHSLTEGRLGKKKNGSKGNGGANGDWFVGTLR